MSQRSPLVRVCLAFACISTIVWAGPQGKPDPKAPPKKVTAPAPKGPMTVTAKGRYTEPTPDAMIKSAAQRAHDSNVDHAAMGAFATMMELDGRASNGLAQSTLDGLAKTESGWPKDVRSEAQLLARSIAEDSGTPPGIAKDEALGVITQLSILGPFRDTGGGLTRREGPEAPGGGFAARKVDYSWGTVEVRWRGVPQTYATASGVPLDVFIAPRSESCTYIATRMDLAAAQVVVVRLAATGSARLVFDGMDVASNEEINEKLFADRFAARIDATQGTHLIAAKVCSGALDDDGLVRLRVTDEAGERVKATFDANLDNVPTNPGKQKATRVPTPLERALTPTPTDLDATIDAILMRTLGGADDAKSPRAPGLLDAVTSAPGCDADRFALAGWVAPFGANRSGWLYLAQKRGKENDPKAGAFAERRLIDAHLAAHMPDWARAAANATLNGANDAEAVLLDAGIDESMGTDALRLRAMSTLSKLVDAKPNDAPSAVVYRLASLAWSYDASKALAAREILAKRGYRGAEYVDAIAQTKSAQELVRAAKEGFIGHLGDSDDGIDIAKAVARSGTHDIARELFGILVQWSPNSADAWAGLADEAAASGAVKGPDADRMIQLALQRARELEPGDARYRAQLALRAGQQSFGFHDDEKYIATSQTILARRQGVPQKPDVADRQLHWLRAVIMHPDRRVSQLIQYAREIVIAPRTQEELVEDLPAEGDTTEILRARVHRKDGGTAFPLEEHNEGDRPRIRWPDLYPGDTVEVAIRTWTDHAVGGRGDPPYYFMDYAGTTTTHPLLYNEVVVEVSQDKPIYLDVIHADPSTYKKEEKDEGGKHITRLVWDKPPTVPDEPFSPSLTEVVPVILGSTFKSWTDFRTWYAEAVKGFTEPDEQVKRLAADLTKGKTTRDQKLKALFDFVADNIRYVNYVSAESWLPNRPQQLLARREGDCDDKAILLITLLRAVGIEAQEVMVQTRETNQPSILLAKNVAVPLFDHGIAFLPGPDGGMYLDATSPQSRLGPVPSMDARAVALRMDSGPAEIVHLPNSSPDDHGSDVVWTISLKADGSGDLAGEENHTGDGGFFLRTYLKEADARAQYVEDNLVGGWFPSVDVDKDVTFDGELAKGAARVKYKAHSDGFARKEQDDLVVPLSSSSTLASTLAPLVTRTLPVALPPQLAPSHQARTLRVTAPQGYTWGDLPPGGEIVGGEFGKASLTITRDPKDPRVVVAKRTVLFDLHFIPVEKYPAWRTFIQKIDALMHRTIRAVKGSK